MSVVWPGDCLMETVTVCCICMHHACVVWVLPCWRQSATWCLFIKSIISSILCIVCKWMMYGCNYCAELNVLSGYMCCSRFKLPLPDRNRRVPDRYVPFPISRNIAFVFPSAYPVPVPVSGKKKQEQEWFRCFPDRSRPFSSLYGHMSWNGLIVNGANASNSSA